MKPAVTAKNAIETKTNMTSPMVHRRLLLATAIIRSKLLWPDEGVDEVDEDPERQQRSQPDHENKPPGSARGWS